MGAYRFWSRFKGLMLTKSIPEHFAMHICPCPSIHTFFMRFTIDVLYLNDQREIVGLEENLAPGKIGKRFSNARSVVELPAGTISTTSIEVGQTVAFSHGKQEHVS
ncbi:DUF192 domain-containing protein [Salipaludibacillus sp. CF4.18]|uniref:DUF192 domain-containing protein n=1 Tax=Salipaludibacillus sp. CF4.18 TaxID=3373081 RepID=UPI003EE444A7